MVAIVEKPQAAGVRPAVVARGIGVTAVPPQTHCGSRRDEAMLISQRTGVPVVAMADRVAASAKLISQHPEVQVLSATMDCSITAQSAIWKFA